MKKENLATLLYYIKKVTANSAADLADNELADLLALATSINEIDARFEIYDSNHSECYVELYVDTVSTDEEEYEVISKSADNKFRAFKNNRECDIDEVISDIEKIIENGIYTVEDKYEQQIIYVSVDFDDIMNYIENHYFDDELFNADYAIFLYDDSTYDEDIECWSVIYREGCDEFELMRGIC